MLGESVFLSVLDRGAVVTLAEEESRDSLRVVSEVGARLPIHCTSQGKLFLANLTASETRHILRTNELTAFTPNTFTRAEQLLPELEQIRRQGYALENGEYKLGLRSVSVPVRDVSGRVAYAVGCVGLLPQERLLPSVAALDTAAQNISRAIGYRR